MSVSPTSQHESVPRRRRLLIPALAIGAGALLLAGGGTTLAYWSTSLSINGGNVTSGDLNLTTVGTPTWTIQGAAQTTPTTITDPTAVTLVPGDVLTLNQEVQITLVGDTIAAEMVVDTGSLPTGILATVNATGVDTANLTAANNGATVAVTVQLTFDSATANRDLVNTTFDLTSLALTLTQKSAA